MENKKNTHILQNYKNYLQIQKVSSGLTDKQPFN